MRESWQAEEAAYLDGRVREDQAEAVAAMGEWLSTMRPWSIWGTLTIDHRRRQGQRVETRSPVEVEWRGSPRAGYVPELSGGGRVVYEHRLDAPRPVPRDSLVWMVEQAMAAASRVLRRRLDWVAAIEPHKSGDLHAHTLVYTGQVGENRNDIRALHKGWFCLAGGCDFSEPRDNMAVSDYTAKYMCKPMGELIFSRKLHLTPEPQFSRLPVSR
jgi:hypothetical protein